MTDLAAVVLSLRPVELFSVPQWTGHNFRAWFLNKIGQFDAALSAELHDEGSSRAYTVSSLMGLPRPERDSSMLIPDHLYEIRLTTLQPEVSHFLLNTMVPHLQHEDREITIDHGKFTIEEVMTAPAQHPLAGQMTIADLIQGRTLQTGHISKAIEMIFDSPTTFKSGGMNVPFPLPGLVFGNLIDRWNNLNALKLHPDTRRFAEECLAVSRHRLETTYITDRTKANFAGVVGFTGSCRYTIRNTDRYWMGLIHTLAHYAFYAGVGQRTTMGMGRVFLRERSTSTGDSSHIV